MNPWLLPKLMEANRNAATVYLALRWLSGERRQLNTTRRRIAEVCGLHERRISEAMQSLHEAGWVTVNYGRAGIKTWFRLSFPVGRLLPVGMKTTYRERKVGDKNDLQGTVPCVYENDPQSLKRLGPRPAPALPLSVGPSGTGLDDRPDPDAIERERLATIRAKRTAGSPAEVG